MFKKNLIMLSLSSLLLAESTMCFKKDITDPSIVETTPLDGGKCLGIKTLTQMKKDGWILDDMKISSSKENDGMNYIFILKKNSSTITPIVAINKNNLKASLLEIEKEKKAKQKANKLNKSLANGKKIYTSDCASCHGEKASKEAYNTSRALNTLSLEDMQVAIRDYTLNTKDNGMAIVMQPYANGLTTKDVEDIYKYIQTLKNGK